MKNPPPLPPDMPRDGELLPCVGGPRDGQYRGCYWIYHGIPSPSSGFFWGDDEYRRDGKRWVYVGNPDEAKARDRIERKVERAFRRNLAKRKGKP